MSVFILILALLWLPMHPAGAVQNNWHKYEGAGFEFRYPPGFRVRPSQRSTAASGYDSAFFVSSDGSVEFYVFAPQWNGTPRDIAVDTANKNCRCGQVFLVGCKHSGRCHVGIVQTGSDQSASTAFSGFASRNDRGSTGWCLALQGMKLNPFRVQLIRGQLPQGCRYTLQPLG